MLFYQQGDSGSNRCEGEGEERILYGVGVIDEESTVERRGTL